MKKLPPWVARFCEALLLLCAYLAVVQGSEVATNVTYYSIGLAVLFATLFIFAPKEAVRKATLTFAEPSKFSYLCDLLVLALLVVGGWWWCAAGQTWQLFARAYIDGLRRETIHGIARNLP